MSPGRKSMNKGDQYERDGVAYLLSIGIPASRLKRGNPTGDVATVPALALEMKNAARLELSKWLDQTMIEKLVKGATYGALIVKRKGRSNVGEHYFVMTVEDGVKLLIQAGVLGMVDGSG